MVLAPASCLSTSQPSYIMYLYPPGVRGSWPQSNIDSSAMDMDQLTSSHVMMLAYLLWELLWFRSKWSHNHLSVSHNLIQEHKLWLKGFDSVCKHYHDIWSFIIIMIMINMIIRYTIKTLSSVAVFLLFLFLSLWNAHINTMYGSSTEKIALDKSHFIMRLEAEIDFCWIWYCITMNPLVSTGVSRLCDLDYGGVRTYIIETGQHNTAKTCMT